MNDARKAKLEDLAAALAACHLPPTALDWHYLTVPECKVWSGIVDAYLGQLVNAPSEVQYEYANAVAAYGATIPTE